MKLLKIEKRNRDNFCNRMAQTLSPINPVTHWIDKWSSP
jgi:hypothetical protein